MQLKQCTQKAATHSWLPQIRCWTFWLVTYGQRPQQECSLAQAHAAHLIQVWAQRVAEAGSSRPYL